MRGWRRAWLLTCAVALSLGMSVLSAGEARAAEGEVRIQTLSNRADLISGGDALVEVTLPSGTNPSKARVEVAGRDVTGAFAVRSNGRFQGIVKGLPIGKSVMTARLPGGQGASLTIDNHPIGGPVFAGPQTQPWICITEDNGLGKALDAQCNAPTQYRFVYRSTDPTKIGFQGYDPANPPSDLAQTTTDAGRTVPFIVRVETGVIDRGIYSLAVLFDPAKPWEPWAPQPGWNGKLLWPFGGDCKPLHKQDMPVDPLGFPVLDPPVGDVVNVGVDEALGGIYGNGNAVEALTRGFAVADSALNKLGSQCNTVVSAEAIMMLKEHIIEAYGPIRYTIGAGASGGAMQQQQIASAYPGLLDGIQPAGSFPDVWQVVQEAEDCHILNNYFNFTSPHLWAATPQRDAVLGYLVSAGCLTQFDGVQAPTPVVGNYAGTWMDPDYASGCGLDAGLVYNAATNPKGVRCTLQDYMISIFGRRASDGFANRPYDNVGVQYGLQALVSGKILAEQFVDLNEKIGGLDIDWNFQSQRSVADPAALEVAYRAGLENYGREMAKVPTIDIRGMDNVEIHSDFHSYAMRARLDRANGHHDNQVIFTGLRAQVGDPTTYNRAFDLVDEWLARVEADRSSRSLEEKVRLDRPAAAVDTCWLEGQPVTDQATCRALFPYFGDPRIAAGGPLTDDILKCRLKPPRREDYGVSFTDDQWSRLQKAFPAGVCDYARPGVAQKASVSWLTFAGGPGGRAVGDAPRSVPLGAAAVGAGKLPATGGGSLVLAVIVLSLAFGSRRALAGSRCARI